MFISKLSFVLIILLSISMPSVFAQNNDITADQIITMLGWILLPIGGLVGYFLRQYIDRININYTKHKEYELWLLQKFHPLSEKYYFPLARFSFESYTSIKHASKSNNADATKEAYFNFGMFVAKYTNFKSETGGNFLFRNRYREKEAIQKIRAILRIIPFSVIQLNEITKEINAENSEFQKGTFEAKNFGMFSDWITSKNCQTSVNEMLEKFIALGDNLDNGAEETSHPDLSRKTTTKTLSVNLESPNQFYILSVNSKEVRPNEKILVYGNGFEYEYNDFTFMINNTAIDKNKVRVVNDEYVEFTIPQLSAGFYDLSAINKETKFSGYEDETKSVSLAIRINQ